MLGFGALSSRLPLQLLVRIGPLFGIAYYSLVLVTGQVWQLAVAQVLNACFIAVIQGLAISYVQELLPLQPGRASTLYSNTFPCGAILASPLLGVGAQFGYRVSFVAATGLAVGGLVLPARRPCHAAVGGRTGLTTVAASLSPDHEIVPPERSQPAPDLPRGTWTNTPGTNAGRRPSAHGKHLADR